MSDIVTGMPLPVLAIDRLVYASRAAMAEVIEEQLINGAIVQIEDSSRPRSMRLCYEIRPREAAFQLVSLKGRQSSIFASLVALVDYAETVTSV